MTKGNIKINKCKRCEHEWVQRRPEAPVQCPRCHSPYWNEPYKYKVKKKAKKR
jgi:predicted Zn-ribbon and HTH transcriptional regulator